MNHSKMEYTGRTKIASKEEILEKIESVYRKKNIKMIGFYSSDLDCIIDGKSLIYQIRNRSKLEL